MGNEYNEQFLEKVKDFFHASAAPRELASAHERIYHFADKFTHMTGDRVKDLYATCVRTNDEAGVAVKDLWLFSGRYTMLVDTFYAATDYEAFKLFSAKRKIVSLQIVVKNFEFDGDDESFSDDSTIKLEFVASNNIRIEREAFGPYCPKLARIIKLWALPNLE